MDLRTMLQEQQLKKLPWSLLERLLETVLTWP
jgi:hypothetical protein